MVGLILAATVLFVVGILWEKNSGENHSDSVAQAAETAAEHAAESGGSTETTTTGSSSAKAKNNPGTSSEKASTPESPTQHAGEAHSESGAETHGESGNDEKVLGINYESTTLVILAVLASLALAALVWFARAPWILLLVAAAMLGFAVFDIAEVFHQVDRDEAGIAVLAGFVAVLHLGAGLGSAQLRGARAAS